MAGPPSFARYAACEACEDLRIAHDGFMGMAKAVYVRDEDVELWERAERYAKARRLTMSALVLTALEAYLATEAE